MNTRASGWLAALLSLGLVACGGNDEPAPCCAHHHDGTAAVLPPTGPLPDTSIYQLDNAFTDQDGHATTLASLRGEPALVLMFYGSCTSVCPLIISEAQRVDAALDEATRAHLRVVLVTFDPERDTTEHLHALALERNMPLPRWTLLRGDDDAIRELAMALGVQYRRTPDGQFVHSALVTLLDRDGRVAQQVEGTDASIDPLVARVRELVPPSAGTATPDTTH